MGKKDTLSGRIPASDLPPLKTWDFPRVAGEHIVRSPFKEKPDGSAAAPTKDLPVSSGPLTVGEIEKLTAEARQKGLAEGLAEGRKKGFKQGLEEGRAQGYKAAHQKAEAELNELKAQLRSMQSELLRPLALQEDGLEQAVLRMVVDLAEVVTQQELATRPELLQQAVKASLDALPQQAQQLCFFVHPDDEALLQELCQQERASWEIATDPRLMRGGLKVQGECSFLDYTVEKRFKQVAEQVLLGSDDAGADHDAAG